MKLKKLDDKLLIYMPNKKISNEKENIKRFLLKLFNDVSKRYHINIEEYYIVNLYQNKLYGIIVELVEDEDIIIFSFDENEINMKLNINYDKLFLYEVDDPLLYLDNEIYYYHDKYYVNLKEYNINIFEDSKIIYDDDVYKVLGRGIKL